MALRRQRTTHSSAASDTTTYNDAPLRPGRATPWRRSWGLGLVVIAGFVLGAPVSRLLETYRGVVLTQENGRAFLAFETRAPKWYDGIDAPPGNIIVKDRGDWSARSTEALGRDIKLMQMQKRYSLVYDATIVRIDKPLSAQQSSVAVAELPDGSRLRVSLFGDDLATAAVGRHLRKYPDTWDPVLVDDPPTSGAVPAPAAAPPPAP